MVRKILVCFVCTCCLSFSVSGQGKDSTQVESKQNHNMAKVDTVKLLDNKLKLDEATEQLLNPTVSFKPNSKKSVIFAAVFPGLGQIYNRKYWKLPIVYAGFIGFSYGISWNNRYFKNYSEAYKLIMQENWADNFDQLKPYLRYGTTIEGLKSNLETQRSAFKRGRDIYRRNRDLSIIGALAFYGLTIIDAYVDAQLFDFDISPDLSLKVEPTMARDAFSGRSVGVQCSFRF